MDNDLRILLGATLNEGSSVGDINKAIKNIQKHPSLKAIDLKINIDKQLTNALKNFTNNLNEISRSISNLSNTEKNLSKSAANTTNELSKETQVLKVQNKELDAGYKILQGDGFGTTNIRGDVIGRSEKFIGDGLSTTSNKAFKEELASILSTNDALKDKRILYSSLDEVTGKWTATLKLNSAEQLKLTGAIDKATGQIHKQKSEVQELSNTNKGMMEQFAIAMQRIPLWMAGMTAFYGPLRALQDAVSQIIQIDTQMTELARVLPEGTDTTEMLAESVKIADELGNKISDINKAMIGFAQAGFSEDQIASLTKTATLMSNISELTADQAMETLTAAMIQFKISAEESITIADQLNIVSNKFPITFANLATALERSGSAAVTFGVDMQNLIGHVTAIGGATRESGRIVGNALEIIYSRIGTMEQSVNILSEIGIDSANQSAAQSLEQLAAKWDSLSDAQRQNIGIAVAGRDQLARFLALLNNFQMAQDATAQALNSSGSAANENNIYLQSLEARINKLRNAWTELSLAMGDAVITNTLIGLIELLKSMAGNAQSAIETIGLLAPILGTLAFAAAGLSKGFRTLTLSILTLGNGFKGLGISAAAARSALVALGTSTVIGAVFMGIGFAVEKLISHYSKLREEQQEFETQQTKIVESWTTQEDKIRSLLSEQEELQKTDERYLEISNELAELMPNLVQSIDDKGQAHLKNAEAIREELKYAEMLAENEKEQQLLDAGRNFDKSLKEIKEYNDEILDLQIKLGQGGKLTTSGFLRFDESELNKLESKMISLQSKVATSAGSIREDFSSITKLILEFRDIEIDDNLSAQIQEIAKNLDVQSLSGSELEEKAHAVATFFANIESLKTVTSVSQAEALTSSINTLGEQLGFTDEAIKSLILSQNQVAESQKRVSLATALTTEELEALQKEQENAISSLKELNQVIYDVSQGQSLNAEEVAKLIDQYPTLADHIKKTTNGWTIEKEALEIVRQAKLEYLEQSQLAEVGITEEVYRQLSERLSAYGLELDMISDLASAREAAAKIFNDENSKSSEPILMGGSLVGWKPNEEAQEAIDLLFKLGKIREEFNTKYKDLYNDRNFGVSSSSNAKNKKAEKDLLDSTQARINAINQEAKSRAEINNLTEERAKALETEQKYSESIEKTSILLASQKLELESLVKANKQLEQEKINLEKSSGKKMTGWLDENGEQTKAYIDLYNKSSEAAQKSLSTQFSQWQALTKAQIENRKTIESVKTAMADNKTFLDETKLKNTQQYLDKLSKDYEHLNYEISYSKDVQSLLAEGTAEHNSETEKQIQLYRDLMKQYEEDNIWITRRLIANESAIESEKLTREQIELLNQTLKNNKSAWFEAARAIKASEKELADYREQMADEILDNYKEMLEKRRDLELDAIDASIDAEDKRHEAVMDNLDKELDAFEEIINARLKAMDRANEEEDYQSNLDKLLKERTEIQNKYNTLLKDNSFEAKARRAELAEQIAAKDEEIAELQKERGREIAKQGLEDQLSDREDYIESQKDLEDQAYNATKQKLENEKKLREEYWNSLIEDEQAFYELKENLLSNDTNTVIAAIDSIKAKYGEFFSYLSSQSASLGDMYKTINSNFQIDYSKLDNFIPTNGLSDVQPTNPSSSGLSQSDQSVANQMKINSEKWHTDKANRAYYESENQRLGKSIGAEFDPKTGAWFKNGIRLYHEGGEVGVNGTSTEKWWNRILNLKSNESLGILRNDEVVLDKPLNFVNDVAQRAISGLSNLISNFGTNRDSSSGSSGNTIIERLQVSITGTFNQEDGDDVWEAFTEGLYKKGIRL